MPSERRRLKKALEWLQFRIAEFLQWATNITPADCEFDQDIFKSITGMLRQAASLLTNRFSYLGKVPWLFATADSVEGAAACLAQVRALPLDQHDPATQSFMAAVGGDLEARAAGGELTDALANEVNAVDDGRLDESCGEGYHRDSSHEKLRAPASTLAHLKGNTRLKQVISQCRVLMATEMGRNVLRYEWHCWSRVLQTDPKLWWRAKKIKAGALYAKVYREDADADLDWSTVAVRLPLERPVKAESASTREQLQREYLCTVLVPLQFYEIDRQVSRQRPDGTMEEAREPVYFQYLQNAHGRSRDHCMHTVLRQTRCSTRRL